MMHRAPFVVAVAVVLAATPLAAQTMKLTVVGAPPPTIAAVGLSKSFFVPEVTKRAAAADPNLKIEWTEAYSQTLAKFTEVLETVEEGVAHIGLLLTNFEEAKLPLEQYAALVPAGPDGPQMLEIDRRVRSKVPQMGATYLKYNQVALAHSVAASNQMFTKFPLQKVEDLKGRKIGASGTLGHVMRGTGAVIVTANMAQSYTDIANGVYEGYPIGMLQAFPYKTYQAAPYYQKFDFLSTTAGALSVNKKTWDSLPDVVRKAIHDVGSQWGDEYARGEKAAEQQVIAQMEKDGLKVVAVSPAERKRWAMMMPNIAKEWAEGLDKKGLPGSKVLAAYMDELRAAKVPLVREWDKE
jgi:TRAP-type mannitol/chloroaromatic compound transport system substrate-binding protein